MLLERPGEVVTREEVRKKLWPDGTFVDFDEGLDTALKKLRYALGDSAQNPTFIETIPRRGYRFLAPVEHQPAPAQVGSKSTRKSTRWGAVAASTAAIVGLVVAGWLVFSRGGHALTEKDTIILADFTNTTGDTVFDGTLRQGLAVQLEESPFLSLVSEESILQTLHLMVKPAETKLTPEISRELCKRTGSAAVLDGWITQIGTQYSLILTALNCSNGELLTSAQAQASDKNHVLDALGRAASQIRNKLGESLSTVEKLATPLEQATTPSLEALQAYTLGKKQQEREAPADAVPFLKRAIELDPNFGLAYAGLSILYSNTDTDSDAGAQYATKAFELRDHVSERERLYIATVYYQTVTGELDKTIETLKVLKLTYPRDAWACRHLGYAYEREGQLLQAAEEYRAAISLDSQRLFRIRHSLGAVLLLLGGLDEAKGIFEEEIAKRADDIDVHVGLYQIAYVRRDATGMQREMEWAAGKPDEFRMVQEQSAFALYEGKLERARELMHRANGLAARRNLDREVARGTSGLALYGALVGDCHGVREHVASATAASHNLPVLADATALALCGHTKQAQGLIEDVRARFPKDTLIRFVRIPLASAAIAINVGNPDAATELLQSAAPYENGFKSVIYLRGLAYLQAHKPAEAATEFQKILDRGAVFSSPISALAHLGLGRAYALQGDAAKAHGAYQDFLALWKNADPDIPVLIAAKSEYAKLH